MNKIDSNLAISKIAYNQRINPLINSRIVGISFINNKRGQRYDGQIIKIV